MARALRKAYTPIESALSVTQAFLTKTATMVWTGVLQIYPFIAQPALTATEYGKRVFTKMQAVASAARAVVEKTFRTHFQLGGARRLALERDG